MNLSGVINGIGNRTLVKKLTIDIRYSCRGRDRMLRELGSKKIT
jgi:hypothetical protein